MAYDYRKAVKDDVRYYIENEYTTPISADRDETYEDLYNELWVVDSVTGNASGSYTFNTAKAKEYVEPNAILAMEAMREFGYEADAIIEKFNEEEWEYLDVTIRCYLLSSAISEVLDELYG